MEYSLVFKILVIFGASIYISGFAIPNIFKFQQIRKIRKSGKKPTESKNLIQDKETSVIPAKNLGFIRNLSEFCFWILDFFVLLQIFEIHSLIEQNLFIFKPKELPNITTFIAIGILFTGTILSSLAGKSLKEHLIFPEKSVRKDWELCTTGIYSKIRHPFYSFMILAYIAIPLLLSFYPLFFFSPFLIFIQYKTAKSEEKTMEEYFENKFKKYKSSTRMFF
ncbi:MAG: methyltransferase family protein [Promethearchaeota archaeon]